MVRAMGARNVDLVCQPCTQCTLVGEARRSDPSPHRKEQKLLPVCKWVRLDPKVTVRTNHWPKILPTPRR